LFIPCLVISTFANNFTVEKLTVAGKVFLVGGIVILLSIPVAIFLSKIYTKDLYIRKIYIYGLAFSNFGFVGNAVVKSMFPEIFMEYLIFVMPFWIMIYVWGVPSLLIPTKKEEKNLISRFKALINPMVISLFIGIIIGLCPFKLPSFLKDSISVLGDCMSPIAMLLTGMTIATIDLSKLLKNVSLYIVSVTRLIFIPVLAILFIYFVPLSRELAICIVCSLAMPLGLNTIVVPSAYGLDTSVAAGMALVSHLLCCITIPLIFTLLELVI
jgi:predicted permease